MLMCHNAVHTQEEDLASLILAEELAHSVQESTSLEQFASTVRNFLIKVCSARILSPLHHVHQLPWLQAPVPVQP